MVHHLAAVAALLACGCTRHSPGPSPISGQWVHVQLQVQVAGVLQAFQATVAFGQNSAKTLVCPTVPSAPTDSLRCADGGFDVFASTAAFDVTLRSSGNAFLWTSVQPNADATLTLVLSPLAPAQINGDYATGFDGDACLDTVQQLSISSSTDAGLSYSVKFYIQDVKTQPKVYFLNTKKHPLHYDFAHDVLGVTTSATEFANNTYSGADRTAMGGTLIFYPSVHGSAKGATPTLDAPWTLNFFPSDDLSPEQARLAHRLIEERITCLQWTGSSQRLVYLPAGTVQEQQASDDASAFLRRGIGWMNHTDLYGSLRLQALNPGIAYGTLKRMSPDELGKAVISFRDVLLLTRLPNELPIVGGTITEEFQTPLAHCNIIAHTRGTPNLAYPKAFEDPSVAGLIGKLVRFEVKNGDFSLRETTVEEAEAFWNTRSGDPFVPVSDDSMTGIPAFAEIGFADWVRVGTKAANLAELSHVLGENAPTGLAIPFHYYAAYMSTSQTSAQLCDDAQTDCAASARAPAACQSARALCLPPGSAGGNLFRLHQPRARQSHLQGGHRAT